MFLGTMPCSELRLSMLALVDSLTEDIVLLRDARSHGRCREVLTGCMAAALLEALIVRTAA